MRTMQETLFSTSLLLLALTFYTTTTSAQLSPIQPPTTSPPAPPLPSLPSPPLPQLSPPSPPAASPPVAAAPAPGLNPVPLVPVTPGAAPTATIPKGPTTDIVQILRKAKRFSVLIRLLKTTQLINQLNSQLLTSGSGGLTIFAPEDSAFSKLKAGFLNSLSDRQKVELLQFHTLSSFISISNFDTLTNPVQTQAGDDQRLQLNVTTYGGSQVSMATGAVNATVTGTIYTDSKLAIYQVDKVLLPLDLVLPSKAPAAAPAAAKKGGLGLPKTNSSAADDTTSSGGGDESDSALPADVSAGYLSYKVGLMWVNFVVGVGLVGGAMI